MAGQRFTRSITYDTWRKLTRNKPALVGLFIISILFIVAFLGSVIRPDETLHANSIQLPLRKKGPGFSVTMLKVMENREIPSTPFFNRLLNGGSERNYRLIPIWSYRFADQAIIVEEFTGDNNELPGAELTFHLEDIVYAFEDTLRIPLPSAPEPNFQFPDQDRHGENINHNTSELKQVVEEDFIFEQTFWLGTDRFGRDLLSRLMASTWVSLSIGLVSVVISLIIGLFFGLAGGYFGGWIDRFVVWIINVVGSIPTLILIMCLTFSLGRGYWQIFLAVGLTMWVKVARLIRGQVLSLREKEFVEAGRALGFSHLRIIIRHIAPNTLGSLIVISTSNFASAILLESGLSFLGLGLQPPTASWGRMIKEHYSFIITDNAYLAIFPGLAIMITVLAFFAFGNGLRDALDIKAADRNQLSDVS